ncbi:hypothetical protein Pse7367_0750 [Thalassoporum mexicanum PCC 7367]|uniref:hypothetical protein n=1 Tax=Thalassoporum mexicanum TaxID=3457544 RepID=UPI00029FA606|nr:hypothetical protein [Pseudanabaena sp. PCC 7367]AFY69051.1 hypothetical protein Pse7367_0750 [Pseudanabaena sp. PCC 7367]
MKTSHQILTSLAIATVSAVSALGFANPASANEFGRAGDLTPGSYLGAGASLTTDKGNPDDNLGANISGRYKFEDAPVSLRTSVLFGNGGTAVVPTISYDLPVGDRTNLFVGAGGSFVVDDNSTLLGDRNAYVVQPGVEVSLNENVLLYSNAIVAIDSFESGAGTTASFQGGVGFQF